MTASAQGVDTSSYQMPLDVSVLNGMAFAFAKATNGLGPADPHFAANWAAIRAAGKHRGAYHELTPDDPVTQAGIFLGEVSGEGLEPGDMLAVVASDYSVSGEAVRIFCDTVRSVAGPKCPVLVYSDESRLQSLAEAASYPLWLAWYNPVPPASVSPWHGWTFWQWSGGGGPDGGDSDAFNGTAAGLDAWIASFTGTPKPVPQPPTLEEIVTAAPTVKQGDTGQAVSNWQGLLRARGYDLGTTGPGRDGIDGSFGATTSKATVAFQKARKLTADGVAGPLTLKAALA